MKMFRLFSKNRKSDANITKVPYHLAIIMDGNGRWAKERGLPRIAGHQKGIRVIGDVIKWSHELGIKELSLFAFSTENWNRQKSEVQFLMDEGLKFYREHNSKLSSYPYAIRVVGEAEPLTIEHQLAIEDINKQFAKRKLEECMIVNFCFNYGSLQEITRACQSICEKVSKKEIAVNSITPGLIQDYLYIKTPVDFLIRTSGEERISNFLLWQIAYAELAFIPDFFPSLSQKTFVKTLESYSSRSRRFGKETPSNG